MILEQMIQPKRLFNINDQKDIEIYAKFLRTSSWRHIKACPYILEFPYLTVPDMIKDKLIHKFLKIRKVVS